MKSSIGWYKKTPAQRVSETNPAPKKSNMHQFDNSTIGFVRANCSPNCTSYAKLPKHDGWLGVVRRYAVKLYQRVRSCTYEIQQAGARFTAFTPSRSTGKKLAAETSKVLLETHWNWGGIPWIKHGGSYHYTVDDLSPKSPKKSIHFTNFPSLGNEEWIGNCQCVSYFPGGKTMIMMTFLYSKPQRRFNGLSAHIDTPSSELGMRHDPESQTRAQGMFGSNTGLPTWRNSTIAIGCK